MCILCVIQKWSRQVATMLPWFVIPLIGLWALSQLLPPAFRFEITSPRLACVFVLLVTLFWYEVLMPQLSTWRVRRNARLRERKRLEAIELQKLKKNATRRCRNCSTPYRDQNPGGGRFMCSYCGHVSKRPVLDIPLSSGLEFSGSGILKDIVGISGKMLNGKGWSENGYSHRQEWSESSTRTSGSSYWQNNTCEGDEDCLVEKSYSGGVLFACRLLTSFFMSIRWLWRKIFRFSSSVDESSLDPEQSRLLARQGENGTSYHESRVEKARRKAEEKRQARLEKELSEEEERKQREEVARLVEERRRLRDEKIAAEKCSKLSLAKKERDTKEVERKRQERRKDRDRASSKSNSDGEELDRRTKKEILQKCDLDKSYHMEHQRYTPDNFRGPNLERRNGHGLENNGTSNGTNSGGRYFDRMKGTFLSSSKAFSDSRLFGRGVTTSATIVKENKPIGSADNSHSYAHSGHVNPLDFVAVKSVLNEDEKNANCPVVSEQKPSRQPRKPWHQLFARSTPVPVSPNISIISRPSIKPQAAVQSSQISSPVSSLRTFDNPISFGIPSPFTTPVSSSGSTTSSLGFSPPTEIIFSQPGDDENFEDPCYVPDPISLLGPVSESLDLRAAGYETGIGLVNHHAMKSTPTCEVNKPSPIESPLSKSRAADEKQANDGSWQMWKSPLGQNGLGWIIPSETTRTNDENVMHHVPQNRTASLFAKENCTLHSASSHRKDCLENDQRDGGSSPITSPTTVDPWSQKMFFPALSGAESPFSFSSQIELLNNGAYRSPSQSGRDNPFEHPSPNCWLKKVKSSGDGTGNQFVAVSEVDNHQEDVESF